VRAQSGTPEPSRNLLVAHDACESPDGVDDIRRRREGLTVACAADPWSVGAPAKTAAHVQEALRLSAKELRSRKCSITRPAWTPRKPLAAVDRLSYGAPAALACERGLVMGPIRCPALNLGLVGLWALGCASQVTDPSGLGEAPGLATATGDALQTTATYVVGGADFSCVLNTAGEVECWGGNASGQLGQGDTQTRGDNANETGWYLSPVQLGTGRRATALAAGSSHACALLDNATVKCWGANAKGQLGIGDTSPRGDGPGEMGDALATVPLGAGRTAKAIAAGNSHTCALLDNNTLKCWGQNNYGQLGQGNTKTLGDNANEIGDSMAAIQLGTGRTAKNVQAGGNSTCAILDDNTLKCWGQNSNGQLGLGNTSHRGDNANEMGANLPVVAFGTGRTAKAVTVGLAHACVIRDDNQMRCWGNSTYGQLGLQDTVQRGDNSGEMGTALPAVNLGTSRYAKAVRAGDNHTCAWLDDNTVKCWGRNDQGQLGRGDTANRGDNANEMGTYLLAADLGTGRTATAIGVGLNHSCAALDNGQFKCWGKNTAGQLARGDVNNRGDNTNEMGSYLLPIGLANGPLGVTAAGEHSCAYGDILKCWGNSWVGQLGLGDSLERGSQPGQMGDFLATVNLGTGRTVVSLASGYEHTCALLDNGQVKCWGANAHGQLGQGDTAGRGYSSASMGDGLLAVNLGTGRTAKAVAAGEYSSCALLDNGQVKCWGANVYGQLGLGDTNDRGDVPNEMGDALPAVSLGTGRTAKTVAINFGFACAILDNDTLKCWGANGYGQLGAGDGRWHGNAPNTMGDNLLPVALGTGRKAAGIGLGQVHACAVLDNGQLKCWGSNSDGQLGLGDTRDRGALAQDLGDGLPAVDLGSGRTARAVVGGDYHTCALLDNNSVKCWGDNRMGQLGQGDTRPRGAAANQMGSNLPAINLGAGRTATALAAGMWHNCAILDNLSVKCWGLNSNGQLGVGDTNNRGDSNGEVGNNLPVARLTGNMRSKYFSGDTQAAKLMAGATYDMNDPAWFLPNWDYNKSTFAYKVFSSLWMLGYNTSQFQGGGERSDSQIATLGKFQAKNGLFVESILRANVLSAIDAQLAVVEVRLAAGAPDFQLYGHMQPMLPNDITVDAVANVYGLAYKVLPASTHMALWETLQCSADQCDGFVQDATGAPMSHWFHDQPIDPASDFRFVGAYADPFSTSAMLFGAAIRAHTVIHEFAHYLDGGKNNVNEYPEYAHRFLYHSWPLLDISHDMSLESNGCAPLRAGATIRDFMTIYAYGGSYNCPAGTSSYGEEFAETFATYVTQGRRFRAAALQNSALSAKYAWLKNTIFGGVEYDTDLQASLESGCNDVPGSESAQPGYLSCSNDAVWDGTLPTL
jgi:alpha-tubulin suppressor-like RCC1 family protein